MKAVPDRFSLAAILGTLVLLVAAYHSVGLERYCHLYPAIDTQFAAGFSESAFSQVKVGMTEAEVTALLGSPLDTYSLRKDTHWNYTRDGKCAWADWAWLGRAVVFRDGRVVEKEARVFHD